jgi:BlaI family transcriptional regulator, penicillinase repressor
MTNPLAQSESLSQCKKAIDTDPQQCYFSSILLNTQHKLSRRERQIMDVLYRRGRSTVAEILEDLPDPPSYSAVRAMLRVLEDKKQIRHEEKDLRYVYLPVIPREKARRSAVAHLLETFFDNSTEQAVATLLNVSGRDLTEEDFNRLSALIEQARREGK